MADHEHCAHQTGLTYTTNPPIRAVICCICGLSGTLSLGPEPGHGPHAPLHYLHETVKWEEPRVPA